MTIKRTVSLSSANDAFIRSLWARHISGGKMMPTFSSALNHLIDLCRVAYLNADTDEGLGDIVEQWLR